MSAPQNPEKQIKSGTKKNSKLPFEVFLFFGLL
jgi:hypothetical protein